MRLHRRRVGLPEAGDLVKVVGDDREGDDEGLAAFDPVDPGENVDTVGAEDAEGNHVAVVTDS